MKEEGEVDTDFFFFLVNVEVMQLIQPLSRLARTGTNSKLLLHTLSPLPGHEHSQARSTGMPGAFNSFHSV